MVGQYFRMRSRYASRVMVGTFRAWNVRVDEGVEIAVREAVVSVRQMGASRSVMEDNEVRDGIVDGGSV